MLYVTNRKSYLFPRGLSLVEILVVIAIIGVLIALAFPVLQSVRAAARRTECMSKQRQIILACQNYETIAMNLPRGLYVPNGMASSKPVELFSWVADIEPFLDGSATDLTQHTEQDTLADIVDLQGQPVLDLFKSIRPWARCPSDAGAPVYNDRRPSLTDFGDLVTMHYVAANNVGLSHALRDAQTRLAPNGVFHGIEAEGEAAVEDGTSNTIYFSERIYGSFRPDDQPACAAITYACRGIGNPGNPAEPGMQDAAFAAAGGINRFDFQAFPQLGQHGVSSGHVGGVVAAFGDGSTKFVNERVDSYFRDKEETGRPKVAEYGVWERLIDINDGRPVGEY